MLRIKTAQGADIQEVRKSRVPKALRGFTGGKEDNEEEDEVRRMEKEVTDAVLTENLDDSITSGVAAGEVEEMGTVEKGSGRVVSEEAFSM